LPATLYLLWRTRRPGRLVVAWIPAGVWVAFSLLYYGFPFPNTAYAKSLGTEFPTSWIVRRGLEYAGNSLSWDTAAYGLLAMAVVLCARDPMARVIVAGILAYLSLVVLRLASMTHMSGRHFAIPLFVAIVTAVHLLTNRRLALATAVCLGLYFVWNPVSPVKFGTRAYVPRAQHWSYLDTKFFAFKEGAALINWRPGTHLPDHQWYHYGMAMRASSKRVFVGVYGGEPIGFAGFAAGPDKFIIDLVALSDPLLARLPATRPQAYESWKSGHFHRTIPEGYVESVTHHGNLIEDPGIRQYYNVLLTVTRGPIWSRRRFREIMRINLGYYDHLLPGSRSNRK
jgi:arabinofuranosyltransferase